MKCVFKIKINDKNIVSGGFDPVNVGM